MFSVPLVTSLEEVPIENFWEGILLYHNSPHLVNRRLTGALNALFIKIDFKSNSISSLREVLTRTSILYEVRKLKELSQEFINQDIIKSILEPFDKCVTLKTATVEDFKISEDDVFITVRILLPRQQCYDSCIEVTILDKKSRTATFLAVIELDRKALAPRFPYTLEYLNTGYRLCVDIENAENSATDWLIEHLFVKLENWILNCNSAIKSTPSLSLVPINIYTSLYLSLKEKYGKELVKAWPEKTDPLKYVYEDIAIAAYLITFWQGLVLNSKPTFVDLGCGNGLLVHILNSEGFPGYGIDLRKRKIWDWYPNSTILKVKTIVPSASCLFSEIDWIIGNHSDELTPWIPVIAARSSYKTNFFLLPCCCYDFSGQKYLRQNAAIGTYTEYLSYVQHIASECGFNVMSDKLRIPSTRRTCLISVGRKYTFEQLNKIDEKISRLICEDTNTKSSNWTNNFHARSDIQPVRNCTQLDKILVMHIVQKIVYNLLVIENNHVKANGEMWNRGGSLPLSKLAELIFDSLTHLKNENGGLQTLLKNHRYIFEVTKGIVSLRLPSTIELTSGRYKNKPCWFNINHPDGCFNNGDLCAYKH